MSNINVKSIFQCEQAHNPSKTFGSRTQEIIIDLVQSDSSRREWNRMKLLGRLNGSKYVQEVIC